MTCQNFLYNLNESLTSGAIGSARGGRAHASNRVDAKIGGRHARAIVARTHELRARERAHLIRRRTQTATLLAIGRHGLTARQRRVAQALRRQDLTLRAKRHVVARAHVTHTLII